MTTLVEGYHKIHLASMSGDVVAVFHSLKTSMEPDTLLSLKRKKDGVQAIHLAAERGHLKVLKLLLKYGAKLDARDKKGSTALHYACKEGRLRSATALLDTGAPKEAKDYRFGETPLHRACAGGHRKVVDLLIARGSNPLSFSSAAETPADVADFYGHETLATYIRNTFPTKREQNRGEHVLQSPKKFDEGAGVAGSTKAGGERREVTFPSFS